MASITTNNVSIRAIAAAVPAPVHDNLEYESISEKERELLIKTTGIRYRHVAPRFMTTSDLCYAGATRIIQDLGIDKKDIGMVIFVSQSPDYWLPATSIVLQDRLGLEKSTMAFDINLGCSGYVYGLSVISGMMSTARCKYSLLMVGDISTFAPNDKDKSTHPIFGDAGTATLLEYNENAQAMQFELHSDGSGASAIMIPHGGIRYPFDETSGVEQEIEPGVVRSKKNLSLNGIDVFNFSVREAPVNVKNLLDRTGTTVEDYDYFIFHQANKIMNDSIYKKLKIPKEKVPMSLHDYGNTSSASIPLTLVSQLGEQLQQHEFNMVFSAFGVGLSWASCTVNMVNVYCPPVILL